MKKRNIKCTVIQESGLYIYDDNCKLFHKTERVISAKD